MSDLVESDAIELILNEHHRDLKGAANTLVTLANEAGGRDNISVVLGRIIDGSSTLEPAIELVGVTDVGRQRSHNEDHIVIDSERGIAVLADGMGGCKAGEVASRMTSNIIMRCITEGKVEAVREAVTDSDETFDIGALLGEFVERENTDFGDYLSEAPEIIGSDDIDNAFDFAGVDAEIEEIEITDDLGSGQGARPLDAAGDVVKQLQIGSWLEFHKPDETLIRARLSWISPVTGTLLFTDNKGSKVADPTPLALAAELRAERVRVLENVPLFDRLLGQLSGLVRNRTIEGYDEHTSV